MKQLLRPTTIKKRVASGISTRHNPDVRKITRRLSIHCISTRYKSLIINIFLVLHYVANKLEKLEKFIIFMASSYLIQGPPLYNPVN